MICKKCMLKNCMQKGKRNIFDKQTASCSLSASFYHRSVSTRLDFRKRNFLILLQSKTFTKTNAKFQVKIYLKYFICLPKLSLNKFQIGQFIYKTTCINDILPLAKLGLLIK